MSVKGLQDRSKIKERQELENIGSFSLFVKNAGKSNLRLSQNDHVCCTSVKDKITVLNVRKRSASYR
jgi:hypothetical protein